MKLTGKLIAVFMGMLLITQLVPVCTQAAKKTESVKVTKKTYEKEYKDGDGKIVLTAKFEQPILSGSTKAVKKINKIYEEFLNTYKADIKGNLKYAKEDKKWKEEEGLDFVPYSNDVTMEVTYNKNGILCILLSGYEYTGGAHGMPYRVPHTFDLNTGKELMYDDLLKGTDKEINKRIEKVFLKVIKKNPDAFFEEAERSVRETAGKDLPFYLSKTGMVFFRGPYDLGPYASGYTEAKISYKTTAAFKIDLR